MIWVKWVMISLFVLFTFSFLIMFIYFLRDYLNYRLGKKKKVVGFLKNAQTIKTSITKGRQDENVYCYGYTVDGKSYEGEFRVNNKDDDHSTPRFEIEYLVSNPRNHTLVGIGTIERIIIICFIAFGFLLFFALAIMSFFIF